MSQPEGFGPVPLFSAPKNTPSDSPGHAGRLFVELCLVRRRRRQRWRALGHSFILESYPVTTFSTLGLAAPLLKALEGEGYTTPTPIQTKAIPAILTGTDLLGIAQTGTGKTAAFALPILHRLAADQRQAPRKGCRVLVLTPTRELASQIADSFRVYGRYQRVSVTTVFGGVGHRPQIQALARGIDVLIATPGRLLDHIGAGVARLQDTEILVLDEADQMLDLGFVKPIRNIVAEMPENRQTLFFSATMPREISRLAQEFLTDPVKVTVTPIASTVELITQRVIHVDSQRKRALLAELLADQQMSRTLVFTRTKRGADRVAKHLETRGIRVAAIHGNKSQRQRELALAAFRNAKIEVLVATDIAARGIDVDAVSHVINYELPEVPEAYVHRIGRTARAGASGSAISLCDAAERDLLRSIERLIRQSIPSEDRQKDSELEADKGEPRSPRGRRGNRTDAQGKAGNRRNASARPGAHRSNNRSNGRKTQQSTERKEQTTADQPNGAQRSSGSNAGERQENSLANVGFLAAPQHRDGGKPKATSARGKGDGSAKSRPSPNGAKRGNNKNRRQRSFARSGSAA